MANNARASGAVATGGPTSDGDPFRFLDLPKELRLMVYEEIFPRYYRPITRGCPVHAPLPPPKAQRKRKKKRADPWTKKKKKPKPKPGPVPGQTATPMECICPPNEPSVYLACGGNAEDFAQMPGEGEEVEYEPSKCLKILLASKDVLEEALPIFLHSHNFWLPLSDCDADVVGKPDHNVLAWLLEGRRRQHLSCFRHVEWRGALTERHIRIYAAVIMLVELGILRGSLCFRYDSWLESSEWFFSPEEHFLCELRVAVRNRITHKQITKDQVNALSVDDVEELMCAVAMRWRSERLHWREVHRDRRIRPCAVCPRNADGSDPPVPVLQAVVKKPVSDDEKSGVNGER